MKTTLRYEFVRGRTPLIVKLEIGVLILAYNLMRYVIARGRARATARDSQHCGCGNGVHLDSPDAVRRPKIAQKSILKARCRSRGGCAV